MSIEFDINRIVNYLNRYKFELPILYNRNSKIERLVELETLTNDQVNEINSLTPFEKELQIKKIVGRKLKDAINQKTSLFDNLCLWVIKDWGGITSANDVDSIKLIRDFLKHLKPNFRRIASLSKVVSFLYPDKNVIYDSRVAYSLNWIIFSEQAGRFFFPIPEGRNSKTSAFDLSVIIRLKNISNYIPKNITCLDDKHYIKQTDDKLFIDKKNAYSKLNELIIDINHKLWKGDKEKEQNLYYTEMLLYSIADREIFGDVLTRLSKLSIREESNL